MGITQDGWWSKVSGNLVEGDWIVDGKAKFDRRPASMEWSTDLEAEVKAPKMGDIDMRMNVRCIRF